MRTEKEILELLTLLVVIREKLHRKRAKYFREHIENFYKSRYGITPIMQNLLDADIELNQKIGFLRWVLGQDVEVPYIEKLLSGEFYYCLECGSLIDNTNNVCEFCTNPKNKTSAYYKSQNK